MNICVLLIFMFLITVAGITLTTHHGITKQPFRRIPMRLSLAENVKGQSLQHTNITQTRRIKRELTCLAQLFIFAGLIIFRADFMNLLVCT